MDIDVLCNNNFTEEQETASGKYTQNYIQYTPELTKAL